MLPFFGKLKKLDSLDILEMEVPLDVLESLDKLEFIGWLLIFFNFNSDLIIFCNFYAIKCLFLHMIYSSK